MVELIPWVIGVQMLNFIVLIFIMNAVLYKPIRNILIERRKKIRGFEEAIDTAQQGVAEGEETFQAKIGDAKAKGFHEKEALKESGEEEEQRIISELQEKAQADLEAARAQIAKAAEAARGKLKAEAEAFSGAIAEKILGRAVS